MKNVVKTRKGRKDYLKSLPKKHSGAGVIFFNNKKQILLVKPTYKKEWILPGGVVEKGESPRISAIREVKEELGLNAVNLKFACLDWKNTEKPDNFQFLFNGGILTPKQIKDIELQKEELSEFGFFDIKESFSLLTKSMSARLKKVIEIIKQKKIIYLENGKYV